MLEPATRNYKETKYLISIAAIVVEGPFEASNGRHVVQACSAVSSSFGVLKARKP